MAPTQHILPIEQATREAASEAAGNRILTTHLRSLHARTVIGLQRAVAAYLERGFKAPLTISGLGVYGYGGPVATRQPGPTISLEVGGKAYTATRTLIDGRVHWLVDERPEAPVGDVLAPLVAEVSRILKRPVTAHEAAELAAKMLRDWAPRAA